MRTERELTDLSRDAIKSVIEKGVTPADLMSIGAGFILYTKVGGVMDKEDFDEVFDIVIEGLKQAPYIPRKQ